MQIELKELIDLVNGKRPASKCNLNRHGVAIVIADRGHVWVGDVVTEGDWCVITRARAVRLWGTTRGLGEIAKGGPTPKTVLDPVGEVRVSMKALIAVIPCEASKWNL